MSRRLLTLLIALIVLLLALAACSGTPAPSSGGENASPTATAPVAVPEPEETSEPDTAAGLCPEAPRPALVAHVMGGRGQSVAILDSAGQPLCELELPVEQGGMLRGNITAANGSLFYVATDGSGRSILVWQLGPDGQAQPLGFTRVPADNLGPYNFAVSEDGSHVAWSYAVPTLTTDGNPPIYRNTLHVANREAGSIVTLVEDEPLTQSALQPVRFSEDNATLFYARQPDGLGGLWNAFSGRYQAIYRAPTAGGDAQLLFDCEAQGLFLCIGDVQDDGTLAYVSPEQNTVTVLGPDGAALGSASLPESDFVGFPTFNGEGTLAFASATLDDDGQGIPLPLPGAIHLLRPPYDGQPETLLSENGVATIWQWLDDQRLVFWRVEATGSMVGIVGLDGRTVSTANFPMTLLR